MSHAAPGDACLNLELDAAVCAGELRRGVKVSLKAGRVARVEPIEPPRNGRLGLPGFVNAHCHLDLTSVRAETLPRSSFPAWVEALVERRRSLGPEEVRRGIEQGARELLQSGTVQVGDIDATGEVLEVLGATGLQGVVFRELLGTPPEELYREALARWQDTRHGGLRAGLSPHAPYSTPESTYRRCLELSSASGLPLATHVAETEAEREYLCADGGPFRELFDRWRFERPRWSDPGQGPLWRVLALAGAGAHLVVVHANHAGPDELEELARRKVAVVYCPRSHEYFDHPAPHPAGALLPRGVPVALGTDSRASNPGLCMWEEMACWRRRDPGPSDAEILRAATRAGREALRLPRAELSPGDPATFQVARFRDAVEPHDDWLGAAVRGQLCTESIWIDGVRVHHRARNGARSRIGYHRRDE